MQLISAFKRYLEWEGQLSGLRRWVARSGHEDRKSPKTDALAPGRILKWSRTGAQECLENGRGCCVEIRRSGRNRRRRRGTSAKSLQ